MTIEQKAQRYNEAFKRAKRLYEQGTITESLSYVFPELKESEDERIRKALIKYYSFDKDGGSHALDNITPKQIVAWLEKQGMPYTKRDVDDAYLKGVTDTKNEIEKQYEANYQIRKDIATFIFNYRGVIKDRAKWMDYLGIKVSFVEKQGEQNPADKVEPKFKIGDWVINRTDATIMQIVNNIDIYESVEVGGQRRTDTYNYVEWDFRLWTIQDAKDGDVLAVEPIEGYSSSFIAIYKKQNEEDFDSYCFVGFDGKFYEGECGHSTENIHPATKEQRDQLEKAMADAGYTFDFEKKELKKIGQKPAWSKEDERTYRGLHNLIYSTPYCDSRKELSDFLDSLKNRLQSNLQQEWGKEDEKCIKLSTDIIDSALRAGFCVQLDRDRCVDWLKSLRPQNTWKPNEEQMLAINTAINVLGKGTLNGKQLIELREELQKLREDKL